MKTPIDFRNEVLGKAYDIDCGYGAQCWDAYAFYMKWLGYGFAYCTTSNYVKDIWTNRNSNGILKYCDEVGIYQQGDIVVFKEVPGVTPDSHIAIFMSDNGDGTGNFLGQNQGGINGSFNETRFPYSATYATGFRPKCYKDLFKEQIKPSGGDVLNSIPSDFVYEKGTFNCTVDAINIRKAPSLKGALTGDWYTNKAPYNTVRYDGYVKRDGYVWISYIGKTLERRWLAVREIATNKPWGTFS